MAQSGSDPSASEKRFVRSRSTHDPPFDHDDHDDDEAEARTHGGALQVSPDLKRHVRVSTVMAMAEAGAYRVVLLGELKVHEVGLALVFAPNTARVRVTTGITVAAGDWLGGLVSVEVG